MIIRYHYWNADNGVKGAIGVNSLRVSETSYRSPLHHSHRRSSSQSYLQIHPQLSPMWIKTKWTLVPAHRLQLALVRGSVAFSRLHVMYLDYHVATRRQNYRLLILKSR